MGSKWIRKGTQNCCKSAKIVSRTLPEWVSRPSLEKVVSWTFPETPLCAEILAPAMLLTLPRGCPQACFGFHLDSFGLPFGHHGRPKIVQGPKTRSSQKTFFNTKLIPNGSERASKMVANRQKLSPGPFQNGSRDPV